MTIRVGIDIPKIEIRYENISIEGDAFVGSRALPTLLNYTINSIEVVFSALFFLWIHDHFFHLPV